VTGPARNQSRHDAARCRVEWARKAIAAVPLNRLDFDEGTDAMADSSLPPEIRELPVSERIDLVEAIWDSIVEDQGRVELTDAQKAELDRRLAKRED